MRPNDKRVNKPRWSPVRKLMKKRHFNIVAFLLTSLLISACASNVHVEVTRIVQQTVEVTRVVQQTLIIIQSATPNTTPYPLPAPNLSNPSIKTPPPLQTLTPFIKLIQNAPTLTSQQVADKIAACYPDHPECSGCKSKLNNSVQNVVPTTRMFINVPKDLYPKELFQYAATVKGNASMGYISNGGLPGFAMGGSPECWSTYVEFDGEGEIDLRIPSTLIGVPDYYVRFVLDWDRKP